MVWMVFGDPNSTMIVYMDLLGYETKIVVPSCPFSFWVPLLKPNRRKKCTLIVRGYSGT